MASISLESRVIALEAEVARLKETVHGQSSPQAWKQMIGAFANDPVYEEAMALGRKYRESPGSKGARQHKGKK